MRALVFSLLLLGCDSCPDSEPSGDCSASSMLTCNYGSERTCDCENGQWICGGGPDIHAPPDLARGD